VQQIAIGGESKVVMLRHLACPPCFGLFCFDVSASQTGHAKIVG
jgi:hypothetical protein